MTQSRIVTIARETALSLAAVAGALCIVMLLLGIVVGVHPLVFQSGSMQPTISTGDLSLARTVAAKDLRIGDVVSVRQPKHERVTHRVVDVQGTGATRQLTLKGDANRVIDPQVYDVATAERVMFTLPKMGYVVAWFSHAPGSYVMAGYVALMLLLIGKGTRRSGTDTTTPAQPGPADMVEQPGASVLVNKHRAPYVALVAGGVLAFGIAAVAGWAQSTSAAWVDTADLSGTTFTAGSWAPPAPTGVTCTAGTAAANTITISWTAVPGATNYRVTRTPGSQLSTAGTSQVLTGSNNSSGSAFVQAQVGAGPFSANSASISYTFGNGNNKVPTCN
jgi:signal peptidase I